MVAIVNPNNPTGVLLNKAELQEISDICAEAGVWLVSVKATFMMSARPFITSCVPLIGLCNKYERFCSLFVYCL